MRRFVTRYAAAGAVACLVGGMLGVVASEAPAYAANLVTFKLSNADIFDSGYNQSFTSVLTATETGGGTPGIPFIQSVTPGTGFTCGAPTTSTATTASCTIEAAPGPSNGDDSGVIGANGTSNSLVVADTDSTSTTYTANETMIIYPAPICGASGVNPFTGVPGTAGAQISPLDATYNSPLGSPTIAESCYDGASGPPSALLTNVSTAGGTIFMGSNATDAAGGTALTIMAGPGFNWTGGVGNGEADVDTGTAGLSKQVWDTATVTLVTVTGGSNTVSTTATSVPSIFPSTLGVSGITVSGTDIPTGTTVTSGAGTSSLTLSNDASATPAGPETLTFTWASTSSPPPSGLLTSASTVATEAAFKSSGDPTNTCPPQQALIDAGMPFCLEEFEATGSGPSATQVALEYAGQNVPTSQAPTVALSSNSGSIGQTIDIADAAGACPEFVGAGSGNPVPASALFSGTNNCWYARAGDTTPVSVTVDGNPATVTPNPTSQTVTNVALTSGSAVATVTGSSVPATFPTNLTGDLVTGAGIPSGTTVTGQGNGTTGDYATVEVTLSNDASATSTESLTFANNADVSEAGYSISASSTVTLVSVTDGTNTVSTTASSAGTADAGDSGFPASLAGDTVSGTDIPVGTQVVSVNATGSNSTSTLKLSNDATATPANETLTFYPAILADPQLNAEFTIPNDTPPGPEAVDVCEATTPKNGNDWEFGVQWVSPTGSLQYVSGSSGPTEICATSTIDVALASSSTTTAPDSSAIVLGNSNSDSATVTGSVGGIDPTGSVDFYECGPTASPTPCTSGSWTQFDTESLNGTSNPDTVASASFTPTSTGYWCFAGVYSGDSNYSGSSDSTTDECFDVTPTGSSTTTAPASSSIPFGDGNTDSATVTGSASADPTGSVDFYECGPTASPTPCSSGSWTQFDTESLSGTSNPDTVTSASFTPTSTGYWCFAGVYSGDSNYSGSSDSTTDECFDVTSGGSSTSTTPGSTSIVLGAGNSDSATVTGSASADPTGSVDFYECGPTASPTPCTSGSWTQFDTESLNGTSNPDTVTSASFTPTSTGYWCFAGVYSGDSNYSGSSDSTTDECFDVSLASVGTVTTPASSSIVLGASNTDGAVVTGNAAGGSPTGNVTFYECGPTASPTPCTSEANQVGFPVGLTAGPDSTSSAGSASFTPTSTGYWCFAGYYSGDSNYSASSDAGTDECFDVTIASSATVSTPESSSIVLGDTNADSVVVTGNAAGAAPTGSVDFYECGPSASPTPCTSETNQVGSSVGLTAGAGYTSSAGSLSFTPTSTGYWCFAAVYSGDSNYSASSDASTDECFDVTSASTSTTTTPTSSTGALGGPNSDVAVVTGNAAGGSPTGTVSFYECGPTATPTVCTSKANPVGVAEGLTAGGDDTSSSTSVNFTATSTGYWCFAGYYSGDSNYSASSDTSTDECFDVTSGSTSTVSTPTSSRITLGQSDTDNATVTGNAAGGSPTGTVSFYECGPTSVATPCTSKADEVGTAVDVTAGADDTSTAVSVSFTPSSSGYWCYGAYYSGDSNYSSSSDTSVDECVDVTSPVKITTASPLPDGTHLVRYSLKFAASGGTGPYKWSVASGSLPHGITLSANGQLSGTPTVTGYFAFTVHVRDSSDPRETAHKKFSLTIKD